MSELLYMQVADNIMERIHNGVLREHEKLSERKLAIEYQVSRTVIREAIKLLNEKGLVNTVYGKGSYVKRLDDQFLMNKLQDAMDMSQVELNDVLEARELLESSMVDLILNRIEQKDIEVLEELHRKMEDNVNNGSEYIKYDANFHLALSICTHNRVLAIMTGTLNRMANRELFLSHGDAIRKNANQEHLAMLEALKHKDKEAFRKALNTHIGCIRSRVGGEGEK